MGQFSLAFVWFQFLIGRLDTCLCDGLNGIAWRFQFLIGRLDTQQLKNQFRGPVRVFQFLIGRLDTRNSLTYRIKTRRFNSS